MFDSDIAAFSKEWNMAQQMFNRAPSSELCGYAFKLLANYSLQDVVEGLQYSALHSTYAPTVADVVKYIERKYGESVEALEAKAHLIYKKYFQHPDTGADHVCDDRRVAYAFQVAFGSLREYGSKTTTANSDVFDEKEFVKAYVNALPREYNTTPVIIKGLYHDNNPRLVYVGKHETCAMLARREYGNDYPRLPAPEKQKVNKSIHNSQVFLENKDKDSEGNEPTVSKERVTNILDRFLNFTSTNKLASNKI